MTSRAQLLRGSKTWFTSYSLKASKSDRDTLKDWFKEVDTDDNGKISTKELQRALNKSGNDYSVESIRHLVGIFDDNTDCELDFEEFVALHTWLTQIRNAYIYFDENKNNVLDVDEVLKALEKGGFEDLPKACLINVIAKYDADQTGNFNIGQFLDIAMYIGRLKTVFDQKANSHDVAKFKFAEFLDLIPIFQ
eukprot:TRINITY_DN10236_c0_g2_i1.p1 TRINITY_DN10236_c0_g2~~TRINITY_DN10236_c0_g2_i1.p1  ORF type:complete len:202 (+),score=33.80 TRINITY_DN10236_c0_g2_i1:30-608(+)